MRSSVGIVLPHTGVYPELGAMLAEVFSAQGYHATVGHRAERSLLDRDVLLLAGQCRNLDGLPDLLRQRKARRPETLLWQLEPLPPVGMSARGDAIGLRVAAWDWGRLPRAARRILNAIVPFRTGAMRWVRRQVARPYSREVTATADQQGWKRYDVENYFMAMAEWRWLRRAHAEGWIDRWFTSVQARTGFLRRQGIEALTLPVGYHPGWGRDLEQARDIDVLFLGEIRPGPRGAVLRRLQERLAVRGHALTLTGRCDPAARERWLNRARVTVCPLRMPHDFAGMRVLMALACGSMVVVEQCDDTADFRPGEHFAMAPAEELADRIDHFLRHEEERRAMARRGHQFVIRELTLANAVGKMLAAITTRAPA